MPTKALIYIVFMIIVASTAVFGLALRDQANPIRIGFIATLSGRLADLGVAGRDGALLAVEETNQRGGLSGNPVELISRDNQQDTQRAKEDLQALLSAGVDVVIGPMTSEMALACQPVIDASERTLISPTASSALLSGQEDNLLLIHPSLASLAEKLARTSVLELDARNVAVVFDLSNRAFSENFYIHFRGALEAHGGSITDSIPFHSQSIESFYELANRVVDAKPQSIMVIASAIDAAMLCQQLQKIGAHQPVLVTEWSVTNDVVSYGGSSVEGLIFFHSVDCNSTKPEFVSFSRKFRDRFGYDPSFAAIQSYDATHMALRALEQNPDPAQLKQTILSSPRQKGIQADYIFDRFGDAQGHFFPQTIRNGKFIARD